jgi:hypothetical protein
MRRSWAATRRPLSWSVRGRTPLYPKSIIMIKLRRIIAWGGRTSEPGRAIAFCLLLLDVANSLPCIACTNPNRSAPKPPFLSPGVLEWGPQLIQSRSPDLTPPPRSHALFSPGPSPALSRLRLNSIQHIPLCFFPHSPWSLIIFFFPVASFVTSSCNLSSALLALLPLRRLDVFSIPRLQLSRL